MVDHQQLSNFIWQIADLLRGPYRPPQYERVMLPLVVLRRFDCVLEPTKPAVLRLLEQHQGRSELVLESLLDKKAGQRFHNHSKLDFTKLKADPSNIARNLNDYILGFSSNVQRIFERFEFADEIRKMDENNILYLVVSKFCDVDLHPNVLDNIGMGLLFEDLIRRFNEAANETAGDHFTPREVIQLMVDLLFMEDDDTLTTDGKIFKLLDPACGTGGMLSEAQKHLREMNADQRLYVYGQDFNPRSYAIAASDLLLKGSDQSEIKFGDTLTDDQFPLQTFDYFLANPPFGVDWKRQQKAVQEEHQKSGFRGRFGAGLPRVNDGAFLFLQHMLSKFQPVSEGGSRLAIVFNGSPLFTGGAGSGESNIRKWIIEQDWLEGIIALPEQMFYNTGIGTYIWIITNRKNPNRVNQIQLLDARQQFVPMRRSLGDKRRELSPDNIKSIVCEYGKFDEGTPTCKILHNYEFGYHRVTVERPLRLLYTMNIDHKERFLNAYPHLLDDVQAIDRRLGRTPQSNWNDFDGSMRDLLKQRGSKWKAAELKAFRTVFTEAHADASPVILDTRRATDDPFARVWGWFNHPRGEAHQVRYEPNADLRDNENINLKHITQEEGLSEANEGDIVEHIHTQVLPHVEDAWAVRDSVERAYEINFNRHFYTYTPPRPLAEIDRDIKSLETDIMRLLREITE